jgi:hypothetical protein
MAKRLTAAQKAERAANIKAGKERAQQARDAAAALAAGTAAPAGVPAQNDNTDTGTQGDRDDAAAQEQNKRTSTSGQEDQNNMDVPEQNESAPSDSNAIPQDVDNDAPVATPPRSSGEPAANASNLFNRPRDVSAGDADASAQAASTLKKSDGKKPATQVRSPFIEASSDDGHPRGVPAKVTPSSRPLAASHPERPFWRSNRDLTDADLAAHQGKQARVESAPNSPPQRGEEEELPRDPNEGVFNNDDDDENTETQVPNATAEDPQPSGNETALPEVDGTAEPAPRKGAKTSNKRKRDATGAADTPKKATKEAPKETPKRIGKKKRDALDKAEKSIRTAALAGPPSLEKLHWKERFNDQATVDNLVAQQSEVEETAMTAANLEPLWKMCEKCSLYTEYGKKLERVRGATVTELTLLFLGNACVGGNMDVSLKARCGRCAQQKSKIVPMVGPAYVSIYPALNKVVRAYDLWVRRLRNDNRTDEQRVSAYKQFLAERANWKKTLASYQHNRNRNVGGIPTPGKASGGGGGGFDSTSFGALNRIAVCLESLVDASTFVSSGTASDPRQMR